MTVAGRSVGDALVSIAGREGVRDDAAALAAAVIDGIRPSWVVRPGSIEQLSRVLALAHDAGLALIPRGSGSTLELGSPPARADLVVDLRGLDQVIEHHPPDLTVTVQARGLPPPRRPPPAPARPRAA